MKRNALECRHAQNVRAVALIDRTTCRAVGKIVADYSDNPNGAVLTLTLFEYGEPSQTHRCGGGGYDKFGTALSACTFRGQLIPYNDTPAFFESHGIEWVQVL